MKRPQPTKVIDATVQRRLDRLERLIDDDYDESPAEFERKTGIKMAQVNQWFSGYRALRDKAVRRLEEVTDKPPGWFDGGQVVPTTEYLPGFKPLSIPLLAQAASMGPGADQLHDEVVVGRLTVSPQWVTRTIKPLTGIENLRFIHGYGDSMEPTFADGDILLVDAGVTDHRVDGVYVLEANDRIYIKRVRQRLNGSFEVSSDNPTVKTVDELNSPGARICGRVVWAWNGKKL
ncbi:S24 family peptidase [Variovorax sp. PAMC 28711]|uniref:S24 family peptidase n=1 Tax=Variovorax sp. PAMC 28711 TaxID=1795631 RepID=UPI00078E0A22|nr:S24 family peptidase [Variovorax sp. PAMC 28711]AMM23195.1 hypothetical protein AX767_01490 [Variovorax sp. PAMC 28711]